SVLSEGPQRDGYDLVREHWRTSRAADFEGAWRSWLEAGVVPGTAPPARAGSARPPPPPAPAPPPGRPRIVFPPPPPAPAPPARLAPRAWRSKRPRARTQSTSGTAVSTCPPPRPRVGAETEDAAALAFRAGARRAPGLASPGGGPHSVTVHFGYGGRGVFREH